MTEHMLEEVHNYTKYKVIETLINKHTEGNTLSSIKEVEEVAEDILGVLSLVGMKYYRRGKSK